MYGGHSKAGSAQNDEAPRKDYRDPEISILHRRDAKTQRAAKNVFRSHPVRCKKMGSSNPPRRLGRFDAQGKSLRVANSCEIWWFASTCLADLITELTVSVHSAEAEHRFSTRVRTFMI